MMTEGRLGYLRAVGRYTMHVAQQALCFKVYTSAHSTGHIVTGQWTTATAL
jgi:hypothetical protein